MMGNYHVRFGKDSLVTKPSGMCGLVIYSPSITLDYSPGLYKNFGGLSRFLTPYMLRSKCLYHTLY